MLDDKTEVLSQAEEDRLDKQEETELLRLPAGETEVLGAAKDEQTTLRPLERAYLLGIDGPQAGRKHNVRLDLTKVGRDEARNHIHLTGDRKASRRQATIVARGSYYAIVDKRSGNRTFVNRHRLSREEEFALNFGDEIEMGSSTFRFVREGMWDWRPPQRAGTFLKRRGHQVLLAVSLVVTAGAVYFGLGALRYYSVARAAPGTLTLREAVSLPVGESVPSAAPDYHFSPAVAWLPTLGRCGVATIGRDGLLVVLDGRSGQPLWSPKYEAEPTQAIAAGDVNGDGLDELVFVTRSGGVMAVNPASGIELWRSSFLHGSLLSPALADIDKDGLADVVVGAKDGSVYRCYGRQSGKNFELIKAPDELIDAPPVLSDVDGDGAMDVVQTYPGGKVSVSNAENGTPKSKAYPRSAIEAQTVIVPSPSVGASCAVGLAPGRAEEFVVVSSNDQNGLVYCSSGGAEQLRWALLMNELLPGATYREVVTHLAGPVLGDLTADAQPDVVVGTRFGPLAALDGVTHKSLWQYQGDWPAVLATPALYDFDKDGAADVAFADSRGGVHVVSGRTGQALARTQPDDVKVFASPLVADVDGNGAVDIVVQNAAGLVRILTTNSRTPEKRTFWEMEGGTPGREGTEEFRGFRTRQKLLILASLAGVLLLLATANVVLLLVRASSRRRLEKLGAY